LDGHAVGEWVDVCSQPPDDDRRLHAAPFVSADGSTVALFNGEIYNYRTLATKLSGNEDAYKSDGYSLLPAYERWGEKFVEHLEGEFAIVLIDFRRRRALLSTDVFSTKPLWYAAWRDATGTPRFLASTYESVLDRFGAPAKARTQADANEALIFSWGGKGQQASLGGFGEPHARFPLVKWDLRQHKTTTVDWVAAFHEAVRVRSRGIKHGLFIGLSGGYDSGAIAASLTYQRTRFEAWSVKVGVDDAQVIQERAAYIKQAPANFTYIDLKHNTDGHGDFSSEKAWLVSRLEPYQQTMEDSNHGSRQQFRPLYEDPASVALSAVSRRARAKGAIIYLSGAGADEIISDYGINGTRIAGMSCFRGVFPADLTTPGFFPWCNFYKNAQRSFLMKEELVAGVHGIEGRYPFLDPKVVQEYLWLKHTVKNSEYKRPIADLLRATAFPTMWNKKVGFSPDRSIITLVATTLRSKACWLTKPLTGALCW